MASHNLFNCSLDDSQLTPDGKRAAAQKALDEAAAANENMTQPKAPISKVMEEDFFDMLTKSQSKRMDDQRCSLKVLGRSATVEASSSVRKPLTQQNSIPATTVAPTPASVPKENRCVRLLHVVFTRKNIQIYLLFLYFKIVTLSSK